MDPDGLRLCSIHKLRRRNYISIVVPISWYIWIVITISYHMGIPFMVLKMGSHGDAVGLRRLTPKKSQVCGKTYYDENPKDDKS